jgi:AhpD family alkylhydroperoxidase
VAYIATVGDEALTPLQQEVFEAARRRFTFVPDVVRTLAVRAPVAKAQGDLRDVLLAVSGLNNCKYCGTAHAGTMIARGELSPASAAAAFEDWRALDLSDRDRAMLEFAEKLTFQPGQIGSEDIDALRAVGFDDLNIYDIVLLTAYRNFINRVNDGLGVSTDKLRDRFGDEIVDRIATDA